MLPVCCLIQAAMDATENSSATIYCHVAEKATRSFPVLLLIVMLMVTGCDDQDDQARSDRCSDEDGRGRA